MILGYTKIQELLKTFKIVDPLEKERVKGVHIELRLGHKIKKYHTAIDLKSETTAEEIEITDKGYTLKPGDFVIGSTLEKVHIPEGYWGFVETKGNIARAGLSAHNTDGHIDPGYRGVITLEIKNQANVPVTIYPCLSFAQLFLFRIEGKSPLYNGKYQDSISPTIFIPDD